MLPSFLIPLIGVIVVVFIAFYGFTTPGYLVHFALLAAPIGIFLVNSPRVLLMLIFGLYHSSLVMPGLPQGIMVVHAMMIFFIGLTVAQNIIAKPERYPFEAFHYWLFIFLAIVAITIHSRGMGLRSAGSGLIGGAAYIKLFAGAGFLLSARYYSLTNRQWRNTVVLIMIGSLIPLGAQLLFQLSGGAIYQQFMFVQPYVYGLLENLAGSFEGTGALRFHGLAAVSITLMCTFLVFMKFRGIYNMKFIMAAGFCLALASLSGFRISILEIIGTVLLFVLLSAPKGQRFKLAAGLALMAFFGLIVSVPLLPYMPFSIQRALSWVPFAEISSLAKMDAADSVQWRVEVWKYSLSHWREFFWIGRGFTVDLSEIQALSLMNDLILQAYLGHNYHSGPVSLLLDLGVPGFVTGTTFLIMSVRFCLKPLEHAADPVIMRLYNVYRAKTIYGVFAFYILFGDAKSSFITLCMNLAILESIRITARMAHRKKLLAMAENEFPTLPTAKGRRARQAISI